MKKHKLISLIGVAVLSACSSRVDLQVKAPAVEVPITGVGENLSVWAETKLEIEKSETISLRELTLKMTVNNPSHVYKMVFSLYICLEGEAQKDEIKLYFTEQNRWDDPSKTVRILDNQFMDYDSSKDVTVPVSASEVLNKALQQGYMWVVVRNYASDHKLTNDFVQLPTTADITSGIQTFYPEDGSTVRDDIINFTGIASPDVTQVSVNVDGATRGSTTEINDGVWCVDNVDLSDKIREEVDIEVKAISSTFGTYSESLLIKILPAIVIDPLEMEVSVESSPRGARSFIWSF